MPGKAIKVTERIYWVGRGGWGGAEPLSNPVDCNVWLIHGGTEFAVIDAGIGPDAPLILDNIESLALDPANLSAVLLTHAHCDHSGGAAWLRGVTGAGIGAGALTARALAQPEPQLIGGLRPFEPFAVTPVVADRWLRDGDRIPVGDVTLTVIDTPGHVVDGVCYLAEIGGQKFLFSGDTAIGNQPRREMGEGTVLEGMLGWLDGHWSASLSSYIASLEKLEALDVDMLLPGHGVPNDKATAAAGMRAGRERLKALRDNRDLAILFPLER